MATALPPSYHDHLRNWCRAHHDQSGTCKYFSHYQEAILILWHLDLEPARPILASCYAKSPRGGKPWDAMIMLRAMLLGLLIGCPRLNAWAHRLRADPVLRIIAGIPEADERISPSIGAFYAFFHRLHDGPQRAVAVLPSVAEQQRTKEPRPPQRRPARKAGSQEAAPADGIKKEKNAKKSKKGSKKASDEKDPTTPPVDTETVTARLVTALLESKDCAHPNDLLSRLMTILMEVALIPSAKKGLLGDLSDLRLPGDGSPLPTQASGHGKRTCDHPRWEHCNCHRVFSDPDARLGWDAYRKKYYFGHKFYEICSPSQAHSLPMFILLDPANEHDFTSSVKAYDHLRKALPVLGEESRMTMAILDAGHDSQANHTFFRAHGIQPVIPLASVAPRQHPTRPNILLSNMGIPLCQAHVEMASWGTGREGKTIFVCPVKAGKLAQCPLAPAQAPDWLCQPETQHGPTHNLNVEDNPRLFPEIARNSRKYRENYNLRTACERSNSLKKEKYQLIACRHRRKSFWLIRLYQIALLQHAAVWVQDQNPEVLMDHLLRECPAPT